MKISIEVLMNPERFNNQDMYFYCVFIDNCNSGMFGWCETPEKAFETAMNKYKKYMEDKV